MSSENCPQPKPLKGSDLGKQAYEVAKAMGVRSCETDSSTFNMNGSIPMLFRTAKFQTTANKSSTIGCEQIAQIAQEYNNLVSNVSCTMRKNTQTVNKTLSAGNRINIIGDKDQCAEGQSSIIDNQCDLEINQAITISFTDKVNLSQESVEKISNELQKSSKKISDIAQKSMTQLGGTSVGGKYNEQMKSNTNNLNYNKIVQDNLSRISIDINAENTITISACKIRLSGKQCKMNQNILFDIISTSIVDNTLSQVFGNTSQLIEESTTKLKQKSEAKGIEDIIKANNEGLAADGMGTFAIIIGVVVIGAVIAFNTFAKEGGIQVLGDVAKSKQVKMGMDGKTKNKLFTGFLIFLGVVLIGLCIWGMYHYKKKSKESKEAKLECVKINKKEICNTLEEMYPVDKCKMCYDNRNSEECLICIRENQVNRVERAIEENEEDNDW